MSWDISVFAASAPPPPVSEMPDDWRGEVLGTSDEVREKISECLPLVNWNDLTWGMYNGDGFSYEFNLGRDDPNNGFMVHVRGGGDAVTPLLQLATRWNWYLLGVSEGEWFHHCPEGESGWQAFQAYRDRVLNRSSSSNTPPA